MENNLLSQQNIKIRKDFTGKKFSKLFVIGRDNDVFDNFGRKFPTWKCKCDCGKIAIVKSYYLKNGGTTSCGCSQKETKMNIMIKKSYDPSKLVAKDIFTSLYKDGNLDFNTFLKMSQNNCYYCNIEPSNKKRNTKKKSSQFTKDNSLFIYNGLDRINSELSHNVDNVITCCYICNRAKLDKSINEFIIYIQNINNINLSYSFEEYRNKITSINMRDLKETYFGASVRKTFSGNYNNGDLTVEKFYKLSQLNCYYCNSKLSNCANTQKFNKDSNKYFIYNGLDRIDSSLSHNYDNVITCCSTCNFAKSNLNINDFFKWMQRIKYNVKNLNIGVN